MKNIFKYTLLLFTTAVFAQQESTISFYNTHLNLVNPAYVGATDQTFVSSLVRKQWANIDDAPETQALSFGTQLGSNFAMGLSVVNDKVFIEKQTFITLDFSYKVNLNEELELFMGVKAGANNYQVNTSGLQTYNVMSDASLESISRFNPNVGVGFYLKHNKYYISVSTPKLLNTERAKTEDGFATVATDRSHFYFGTGYDFNIDTTNTWVLTPSVFSRFVNGAPLSTDFSANLNWNKKLDFATTYRTDKSVGFRIAIRLSKNIKLGYAYESMLRNEIQSAARGSHEFMLRLNW